MNPTDRHTNYKTLVQRGYDRCADAYHHARSNEAGPELDLLTTRLKDGANVLDIGCGTGVPHGQALAQRFTVTGVDSSGAMIQRARMNVPQGNFIHGDIMAVDFPPSSFEGIVAFYSIFHLPKEEQPNLFRRIYDWLRPGGHFLCTLTHASEEGYTEVDFFGVEMYWSNYCLADYKEILSQIGFSLLETSAAGHGYKAAEQAPHENHPLVLARRPSADPSAD